MTILLSAGKPWWPYFSYQKLSLIDEQINADIACGFPGAALLITCKDKIVKKSVYGYKLKYDTQGNLLSHPEQMKQNTLFDLASNTKMYATNYALMHLVSTGKLDLNQKIQFYLPKYAGCDINGQSRQTRKVINLLQHDAGYVPDVHFFNSDTVPANIYSQDQVQTKRIIETLLPFERSLGGAPQYSDIDFILLGMIIEQISGQTLDKYVAETFYKPLGLLHTLFNPLENKFSPTDCAATEINGNTRGFSISFPNVRRFLIQGEVHDEKSFYSMGGVSGHAGLFSTLDDMAVLTQIMLNQGTYANIQFWTPEVQHLFTAPNKLDISFGLGWRRAGEVALRKLDWFGRFASNRAIGHTGWTGTLTLIDPEYDLAIILLTNKKHSKYNNGIFAGDRFGTGKYTKIVELVYQAME